MVRYLTKIQSQSLAKVRLQPRNKCLHSHVFLLHTLDTASLRLRGRMNHVILPPYVLALNLIIFLMRSYMEKKKLSANVIKLTFLK